jgi:hypothetical protein
MLHRVAFVRTNDSAECIASIIKVTKISELETLPTKRRLLQEPHHATSQKMDFFDCNINLTFFDLLVSGDRDYLYLLGAT